MSRLKTFLKYILWIAGFSLFTYIISFIGLNSTYKNINSSFLPTNVNIALAQATSVNGRIYGEITSTENENLNGKYMKVNIFDKKDRLLGTKYLKLEGLEQDVPKKFAVNFKANYIKRFDIIIVEDSEEIQKDILYVKILYKDIFTEEELKGAIALALVLFLAFRI